MGMRSYELMVIVNGGLEEAAVSATVDRFTKVVAELGGSVENVDHWGKREFAYEIEHMTEGYYAVVDFELDGEALKELERQLRLADEIVRHKVVRPASRTRRTSTSPAQATN
jgi:small subunit ribosomal protein S6